MEINIVILPTLGSIQYPLYEADRRDRLSSRAYRLSLGWTRRKIDSGHYTVLEKEEMG